MNTFLNGLQIASNITNTENGGLARRSTLSAVYDMFALGGAYRKRSDEDCILLFKEALEENESLALKCLFYLRDCRGGGQGERRFFRVCYKWLAKEKPEVARRNLYLIPEYGRWDDLYCVFDTPLEEDALKLIKHQLTLDMECVNNQGVSLCAKWLKSENASNAETKRLAEKTRKYLGMSHKEYRKTLSTLRERIHLLERLMSENRWDCIDFSKIPSKAGLIYKNAFARRDIIAKKYEIFAKSKNTKVNASTLYPYDIVAKAIHGYEQGRYSKPGREVIPMSATDRAMIEKYWENLPDYLEGKPCKMMCVVDTSCSMTGDRPSAPINVAISLGMYCAERLEGPFKNHYISFSSRPQLIKITGVDFVDKVRRIFDACICENTDLVKTFELLRKISKVSKPEDRLNTAIIISDMEIDEGSTFYYNNQSIKTEMEIERLKWESDGVQMPHLVYWNVQSRNQNKFLDDGPNVTYVSGMSPVIFTQILTGKTGIDLMLEVLNSNRYVKIH